MDGRTDRRTDGRTDRQLLYQYRVSAYWHSIKRVYFFATQCSSLTHFRQFTDSYLAQQQWRRRDLYGTVNSAEQHVTVYSLSTINHCSLFYDNSNCHTYVHSQSRLTGDSLSCIWHHIYSCLYYCSRPNSQHGTLQNACVQYQTYTLELNSKQQFFADSY